MRRTARHAQGTTPNILGFAHPVGSCAIIGARGFELATAACDPRWRRRELRISAVAKYGSLGTPTATPPHVSSALRRVGATWRIRCSYAGVRHDVTPTARARGRTIHPRTQILHEACRFEGVARRIDLAATPELARLFGWEWPSLLYAIELVAWHLFLGLSLLFAASAFRGRGAQAAARIGLRVNGSLCIIGLVGPALGNLNWRMIGVFGYGVVFPIVCVVIGLVFKRLEPCDASLAH
jgi:hypothetical protein